MGQQAIGIFYGVDATGIGLRDEDGEIEAKHKWERSIGHSWMNRDTLRIRSEWDGGKDLLGCWVSVGGSGEDGTPYFTERCFRAADLETEYAPQIEAAKALWGRFSAFMREHYPSVALGEPCLWITPCEVA